MTDPIVWLYSPFYSYVSCANLSERNVFFKIGQLWQMVKLLQINNSHNSQACGLLLWLVIKSRPKCNVRLQYASMNKSIFFKESVDFSLSGCASGHSQTDQRRDINGEVSRQNSVGAWPCSAADSRRPSPGHRSK